jgi:methionyl-tRNA formyltransferase
MNLLFLTNNLEISQPLYLHLKQQGNEVDLMESKLNDLNQIFIKPDYIISYNYRYILPENIINAFLDRIFNLHISLLPWNRGDSPNFWSFLENTPKGVTIHQIDQSLDTGEILVQQELCFDEQQETFASSYNRLHQAIQNLFMENWDAIRQGKIKSKPQVGKGSFHTKKQFLAVTQQCPLDWSENIAAYKKRFENENRL